MYKLIRNNRGLTLTELLIAIFLGSLVILATSSVDLTARGFLNSTRSKTKAQNEASVAMEYMVRKIREGTGVFAISDNIAITRSTSPILIIYTRTASDELEYRELFGASGPTVETIATGITQLNPVKDMSGRFLTITLTARDGDEEITLTSAVTLRN